MGGKSGQNGPARGRPRKHDRPESAFNTWLDGWLKVEGNSIHELSTELGISSSTIYNLRNGYFPPGLTLAAKIEKASDGAVVATSWV